MFRLCIKIVILSNTLRKFFQRLVTSSYKNKFLSDPKSEKFWKTRSLKNNEILLNQKPGHSLKSLLHISWKSDMYKELVKHVLFTYWKTNKKKGCRMPVKIHFFYIFDWVFFSKFGFLRWWIRSEVSPRHLKNGKLASSPMGQCNNGRQLLVPNERSDTEYKK